MSEIAIRVENLAKRYRIGAPRPRYQTLRDELTDRAKGLFRRRQASKRDVNYVWALKNVSFEVKEGEVVGIIGRNGAGKSTLLRILSRITEPTEGVAHIRGRMGSLLEVGTGFHPELTGRENIYLNGAILGMKKAEIDRKFDEIVDFAEVATFIDTPVKRYSSGMYVRLAFAVAAHLEPDILLVDEVLAVGDASFQEKCIGTMARSASTGKTVLFVSHSMSSIQHLCSRAILLKRGQVAVDGVTQEVVKSYLSDAREGSRVSIRDWQDRTTNGQVRIVSLEITEGDGQVTTSIPVGGSVRFWIRAEVYETLVDPCFGVLVHGAAGEPLLDIRSVHAGFRLGRVKGNVAVQVFLENLGLYPGRYFLSPWIADSAYTSILDWAKLCCTLDVYPAPGPHGDLKLEPAWGKYWVPSTWARA